MNDPVSQSICANSADLFPNLVTLGSIAAFVQILGHVFYFRHLFQNSVQPNAVSFLMFAYGSAIVTFLQWRGGASFAILMLPVVCMLLDIAICIFCLRKPATHPIDRLEKIAFAIDIGLTLLYLVLSSLDQTERNLVIPFLIATNLRSLVSFFPLIRSTWRSPERELPMPWLIWSMAYVFLAIEVLHSSDGQVTILLLYPAVNLTLHLAVWFLALRKPVEEWTFGTQTAMLLSASGTFSNSTIRQVH